MRGVTFLWQVLCRQGPSTRSGKLQRHSRRASVGGCHAGAFAAAASSLLLLAMGVLHVDVTIGAKPEAGSIHILTRNDLPPTMLPSNVGRKNRKMKVAHVSAPLTT